MRGLGGRNGIDVAVVGGSIAGCAAALAARRAGAERVTVYERAPGPLGERGAGIAMHNDRYAELEAAGFADAAMPWIQMTRRGWYVRDDRPGTDPRGRRVWTTNFPFRTYNWGPLWRQLRRRVPGDVAFRSGVEVSRVTARPGGGAQVHTATGSSGHDLVIGADGYRSLVRAAACGDVRPHYTGYAAWRGAFPATRLTDPDLWPDDELVYGLFPGGHLIAYRIPDPDGGAPRINWVVFTAPPPGTTERLDTPTSLPPGRLPTELTGHLTQVARELLPPYWRDLVLLTTPEELFLQPLYDFTADRYTAPGMALVGDAATVARPHTGAGAVKALQDAAALRSALAGAERLPDALAAYDADRAPTGRAMVDLGRRLGRMLVQETPDWAAMDERTISDWWRRADGAGVFGGRTLRR
ncbi:FAD-dependent monooxygenase [Streptomyces beihaiensis]|uniref:FAD-dependent monooxygenase n=1 Tax=Streptomyces beihaiensis TaxID=2984495 RepID=A0ABT3U485_9ACTN|nr:FAD-dependent monooxygenase [Streptomyces beihaiensis]MCX3062998.1 FAD-dependent monooxygenase [Streptomyces beihaiensis]